MGKLKITCIEISKRDGFSVVAFEVSSNDSTLYASGTFGIQISDDSAFEIGYNYDLEFNKQT